MRAKSHYEIGYLGSGKGIERLTSKPRGENDGHRCQNNECWQRRGYFSRYPRNNRDRFCLFDFGRLLLGSWSDWCGINSHWLI